MLSRAPLISEQQNIIFNFSTPYSYICDRITELLFSPTSCATNNLTEDICDSTALLSDHLSYIHLCLPDTVEL